MNYEDDPEESVQAMADDSKIKEAAKGITIEIPTYAMESIAEAAAERMSRRMQEQIKKAVDRVVDQICNDAWRAAITDRARAAADEYLTRPRTPTNQWGEPEPSKKQIAFSEQIPVVVEQWLNQMVDSKGNAERDHYGSARGNTKRLDWMLRTIITEPLKSETEKAAKTVEAEARKVVAAHVGKFVAEQMIPAIDIKALNGV